MATFVNRAKMTTATTGSGTITLGSASSGFQSFAAAGVADTNSVTYVIEDGTAWEIGNGVYASSGTTMSRTLVSSSTGSLLVLSGNAVVYVAVNAETMTDIYTQLGLKAPLASPAFTGQASFDDGTAALPSITNTGDTNTGVFFPVADTVATATAGVERMRIDSGGNVGVGTSSPTSILDIYSATPTFNFRGDGGTNITSTRSSNSAGGPNLNLRKARGTTASQTAVASSDYMGFLNFAAYGGATNRTIAQIYAQVSTYTSDTDISSSIYFTTTPTGSVTPVDRMQIDASGNVGIGGVTPASNPKLSMYGGIRFLANETAAATYTGIGSIASDTVCISTSGSERVRIDSSGNVGIGDTTPSTKLDVAGVASAVFYENPTTITANYTITTGSNAMAAGPITINGGVSVTIPSGSVWTVL